MNLLFKNKYYIDQINFPIKFSIDLNPYAIRKNKISKLHICIKRKKNRLENQIPCPSEFFYGYKELIEEKI